MQTSTRRRGLGDDVRSSTGSLSSSCESKSLPRHHGIGLDAQLVGSRHRGNTRLPAAESPGHVIAKARVMNCVESAAPTNAPWRTRRDSRRCQGALEAAIARSSKRPPTRQMKFPPKRRGSREHVVDRLRELREVHRQRGQSGEPRIRSPTSSSRSRAPDGETRPKLSSRVRGSSSCENA